MSSTGCVCSGIRSCLLCETKNKNNSNLDTISTKLDSIDNYLKYIYCGDCGDKAFVEQLAEHCVHSELESLVERKDFVRIDGVFVKSDVVSVDEETDLVRKLESIDWINSQSGRRKQDFGPKVNFKKRKVNFSQFSGLPDFDKELFESIANRLTDKSVLHDFITVEVCHLEYNPLNGSSIDPHFDDFWLWGPRLVTVNLLAPTVLTLTLPLDSKTDANVDNNYRICVNLPQRSVVVLSGDSRYKYEHSIRRQDIRCRRIAITYRELSSEFLPNGPLYESAGKPIIERSVNRLVVSNK